MTMNDNPDYWRTLEHLIQTCPFALERPQGSRHPRYPDMIYPLDYGHLEGTSSSDGSEIDVWIGSREEKALVGVLLSVDPGKRDAEVKLLLGCSSADLEVIRHFYDVIAGVPCLTLLR